MTVFTPLPSAARPGAVVLQVADLSRSLAYYTSVIGLRVLSQSVDSAALAPHDSATALVELRARPGARSVPRNGRLGLYHFAILVPNRAALGRFLAHAAEHRIPLGMADHLVSEALYLWDPNGLGIEVYADRPRDTWAFDDGQLRMASDPLDAEDVVRAAKGEPFTGLPKATVIGHMHLHVSDIAKADAFYHAALGFDRTVWSYPGALFLSAGGYHHHLGVNTWAARAPRPGENDARLLEWELVLPDRADMLAATERLRAVGYPVAESGNDRVVNDPDGTTLRLRG